MFAIQTISGVYFLTNPAILTVKHGVQQDAFRFLFGTLSALLKLKPELEISASVISDSIERFLFTGSGSLFPGTKALMPN